jgi:hypothetical protein
MRTLQLYIANQRVDLFKDEAVSLTQTIKNVKDISKVFTEFTKTFAVPASSTNNKIFQHYYNSEITNGFDARTKVASRLELNDLPFKEGTIRLEGVDLKNNMPHTYRITFFGNTVNLKDIFGNEQLSELDFSNTYNEEYSFSAVANNITNTGYAQMAIPLITHTDRMFYDTSGSNNVEGNVWPTAGGNPNVPNGIKWDQFKYAVSVLSIVASIQTKYNLTFSTDFFNVNNINGIATLYMWLHRKSGAVVQPQQVERSYTLLDNLYTTNNNNNVARLNGSTTSIYVDAYDVTNGFTQQVGSMVVTVNPQNNADVWGMQVLRDGTPIRQITDQQGQHTFTIAAGQNGILDQHTYTFQLTSITNVAFAPDQIYIRINSTRTLDSTGIPTPNVDDFKNLTTFQTNQNQQFNISEQMPKMKVIDFLSGLFKMFNLIAYVEEDIIVIKTLDDYYAASTNAYNIDKYLDTTKSVTDVALPFKQINFAYKGLGTLLAKQFQQLTNGGWGSMAFTLDGAVYDAPSEAYNIEVPFEHMMYERLYDQNPTSTTPAKPIQWGYSVNENLQAYKGEPLLFYGIIQENVIPFRLLDTAIPNSGVNLSTYMIPSNSFRLDPSQSKYNIHFQNELNEYLANEPTGSTNPASEFTNTLFETEYKKYIQGVFDNSMRLKKVTAYLPMKIYYNLQLNDLIEIGQSRYEINSLKTDLITGKTEFELLNAIL